MENFPLLGILSLVTFLVVIALAFYSRSKTIERKEDPDAPKSTLAKDGPQGGVFHDPDQK